MISEENYKCDECGDRFFKYNMDSFDAWDFDEIIQPEGIYTLCKGCIYKMLYQHYRKKVEDIKDLVGEW